jgi:hypothetical protein
MTARALALAPFAAAALLRCGSGRAAAEDCRNSIDDDTDGQVDCSDPDCADAMNCRAYLDAGTNDGGSDAGFVDAGTDVDSDSDADVRWGDDDSDGVPNGFDPDSASAGSMIVAEDFSGSLDGWREEGIDQGEWGITNDDQLVQTMECHDGFLGLAFESIDAENVYVEGSIYLLPPGSPCSPPSGAGLMVRDSNPDRQDVYACFVGSTPGA